MRKPSSRLLVKRGVLAFTLTSLTIGLATISTLSSAEEASAVQQGKNVAFDRKKGNCLSCHDITGGTFPGNIGPQLNNMKDRFPDKKILRMQIWDATENNPNTIMPPFGRHSILTEAEIDVVVEFIHSL